MMGTVETLQQHVEALSPAELAEFRTWFLDFDWAEWDREIERDAHTGKLDAWAQKALGDHASGQTTPL